MPKYELTLNNGAKVNLNSDVTMKVMKKWKKDKLISPNFLGKLIVLDKNPTEFESDDLENAIYLAYLNGRNNSNYSQDEFEDLLNYDLEFAGKLLSDMCAGTNKNYQLKESFKQKTTNNNKNNGGKKHPK